MSRGTRSFKTHALTLFQVELHPAVDAPLEKKHQVQSEHLQSHCCRQQEKIFSDHQRTKECEVTSNMKTSLINKIKSKDPNDYPEGCRILQKIFINCSRPVK
jgi:hypothetical protein